MIRIIFISMFFIIIISACSNNKIKTYTIFRENLKISLPESFENTSAAIFLNDSGQNARFTSKDSSTELYIYLAGDSIFDGENLTETIESELIKRQPNIRLERKTLNTPVQNTAVYYSYTSNNTIGVRAYLPCQNQKLRLDFED
ncbi:MAG TPA: hypothetical protein PKD18_13840 [Saprospiraceae bacterium]|nr:hypothetical protein [Saprospiraceae bacterium]